MIPSKFDPYIGIVLNHEDLVAHPSKERGLVFDLGSATSSVGHDLQPSQHVRVSRHQLCEYHLGSQEGDPLKEEAF